MLHKSRFSRTALVVQQRFDAVTLAWGGSKVHGTTGPSSSAKMVVYTSGGSVERVTTAVLLRQSPCGEAWPNCV